MPDLAKQKKQKEYQEYVKQVTPTHNLFLNMCKAFVTGGAICVLGQFILNWCRGLGMDQETAGAWCSLILVLLSVLLTGFNIYPKLAKFGGAGTLVPITGFANSVAAPAIEYKKRGAGLWNRMQDFHHRGACDIVWYFHQLGAGGRISGLEILWNFVISRKKG